MKMAILDKAQTEPNDNGTCKKWKLKKQQTNTPTATFNFIAFVVSRYRNEIFFQAYAA